MPECEKNGGASSKGRAESAHTPPTSGINGTKIDMGYQILDWTKNYFSVLMPTKVDESSISPH